MKVDLGLAVAVDAGLPGGVAQLHGVIAPSAYEESMGTWTANLFQNILDSRRQKYGDGNAKTLTSMTHMGGILEKRGQLNDALDHYGEAMHYRREVLGDKHPKTLQSIGKMAAMCKQHGQHYEAQILAQEALFGSRKMFGEQAPDTLDAVNNLGAVWKAQGEFKEAEKCFRDAYKRRQETLGPKHPDTLTSLNNLACTVDELGNAKEAGKLYQQCLETRRTVLGPAHPDTMTSMSNLALFLRANGQRLEAEALLAKVLDGRRKIFGVKHPDTIISMNNCAAIAMDEVQDFRQSNDTLELKKAYEKAHVLLREAVAASQKNLGKRHPLALSLVDGKAGLLRDNGNLEEAEKLYEKVVDGMRSCQGFYHLDTLTAINNHAGVLRLQGDAVRAEGLYKEASEGIVKKLGDAHPISLSTLYNWALTLDALGDFESAIPLYLHHLEHGQYTPEQRIAAARQLSERLRRAGKLDEARELRRRMNIRNTERLGSRIFWMRGCTLSFQRLRRPLLIALAATGIAGAAAPEGVAKPIPSCPADIEQGMVAGDDSGSTGKRPSVLLQMTSPRHQAAPVHEDSEEDDHISGPAGEVREAGRARTERQLNLQFWSWSLKEPIARYWASYPYASLGHLSDSSVLVLPAMALISVVFSCSVVVCFVASYRPRRGKSLDSQFEPASLGLPPGYGCKPFWLGT
ncbi:Nphp3 [Symbiodinium microadriaticum]|nr:Nphp3 [Symbiodinium microadriaticum]